MPMSSPMLIKDVLDGLKPFGALIQKFVGPPIEQCGLAFGDSVAAWRIGRSIRLWTRIEETCKSAGINPQSIKFPLFKEIVERASVEDDDELQDRWANLLSNAADPRHEAEVLPAFPDILRQLSKQEANFLDELFEVSTNPNRSASAPIEIDPVPYENLLRLGLIIREHERTVPTAASLDARAMAISMGLAPQELCFLSTLGTAFVTACRTPKRSSSK
jgi:abortive infection alpha-like protein